MTEDSRSISPTELWDAPDAMISLRGSFQRFEFFDEDRETIRNDWFDLKGTVKQRPSGDFAISLTPPFDPNEGAMPLSYRSAIEGSDTARRWKEAILTESEIRHLATTVPHRQLFIVCDANMHHYLCERLRELSPQYFTEVGLRAFLFLLSFQKVAISQSAAAWWAAFLGFSREIYFPKCDRGIWALPSVPVLASDPGYSGTDLRVDDDRYIYEW